jgi:hypothetical protein
LLDPARDVVRVRVSVSFMLSGALEVQARLAREVDPELHRLLLAAHARALETMVRERTRLRAFGAGQKDSPRAGAA